jgi:hypothetical protein
MSTTAITQEIINERTMEEKFLAGFGDFEALIDNFSDDRKSTLIELLEQFTQE